jgi:hypothetical protein
MSKFNYSYVNRAICGNSFEELWWLYKFANDPCKEISESVSAFDMMTKFCKVNSYSWLHIGDGALPRTAALFAYWCKSFNVSIDPALNADRAMMWFDKFKPRGLRAYKDKFQNYTEAMFYKDKYDIEYMENSSGCNSDYGNNYGIIVHSHVKITEVINQYPNWHWIYCNPCCNPGSQMFNENKLVELNVAKLCDFDILCILSDHRRYANINKLL